MALLLFIITTIHLYYIKSGRASPNELILLSSGCACPGHTFTYECTVIGEGSGGATVWQGTAFDCQSKNNEILLLHRRFALEGGTSEECNGGAIVGQSVRAEESSYTSQLNVTLTADLIGERIECAVDNGTTSNLIGGLSILPIASSSQVYITSVDFSSNLITFNWTSGPVAPNCPSPLYNILSSNCGSCPTTTTNTTVTCTDVPTDGSVCTFAVQTVVCGDIVMRTSNPVFARNYSPEKVDESSFTGILAVTISLAVLLILCVFFFLLVITIILIKARSKPQAQPVDRSSHLPPLESNKTQHDHLPSDSVDDMNTKENYAYGLPLRVSVKTSENVAYGVPSAVTVHSS